MHSPVDLNFSKFWIAQVCSHVLSQFEAFRSIIKNHKFLVQIEWRVFDDRIQRQLKVVEIFAAEFRKNADPFIDIQAREVIRLVATSHRSSILESVESLLDFFVCHSMNGVFHLKDKEEQFL